jgi:hypothetical protein
MLAAILVCGASLIGCGNNKPNDSQKSPEEVSEETGSKEVDRTAEIIAYNEAVDDYLVNVLGKHYAEGKICIPYPFVVSTDDGDLNDIKVWGDFWVYNYNLSGDTLKTVSGGNHPGLLHLKKTGDTFEVTNFEAVEDGAGNMESAKRIFGDKYDCYQEFSSQAEKRELERLRFTSDYVKKHNLSATMLQDFGWPAVELPK